MTLVPTNYKIVKYEITYKDGRLKIIDGEEILGEDVLDIRECKVESIVVSIH